MLSGPFMLFWSAASILCITRYANELSECGIRRFPYHKKLCCNFDCSRPISHGYTIKHYTSDEDGFISYPSRATVKIISKMQPSNALVRILSVVSFWNQDGEIWEGEISGKRGFISPIAVKEMIIHCIPQHVMQDFSAGTICTKVPPSTHDSSLVPHVLSSPVATPTFISCIYNTTNTTFAVAVTMTAMVVPTTTMTSLAVPITTVDISMATTKAVTMTAMAIPTTMAVPETTSTMAVLTIATPTATTMAIPTIAVIIPTVMTKSIPVSTTTTTTTTTTMAVSTSTTMAVPTMVVPMTTTSTPTTTMAIPLTTLTMATPTTTTMADSLTSTMAVPLTATATVSIDMTTAVPTTTLVVPIIADLQWLQWLTNNMMSILYYSCVILMLLLNLTIFFINKSKTKHLDQIATQLFQEHEKLSDLMKEQNEMDATVKVSLNAQRELMDQVIEMAGLVDKLSQQNDAFSDVVTMLTNSIIKISAYKNMVYAENKSLKSKIKILKSQIEVSNFVMGIFKDQIHNKLIDDGVKNNVRKALEQNEKLYDFLEEFESFYDGENRPLLVGCSKWEQGHKHPSCYPNPTRPAGKPNGPTPIAQQNSSDISSPGSSNTPTQQKNDVFVVNESHDSSSSTCSIASDSSSSLYSITSIPTTTTTTNQQTSSSISSSANDSNIPNKQKCLSTVKSFDRSSNDSSSSQTSHYMSTTSQQSMSVIKPSPPFYNGDESDYKDSDVDPPSCPLLHSDVDTSSSFPLLLSHQPQLTVGHGLPCILSAAHSGCNDDNWPLFLHCICGGKIFSISKFMNPNHIHTNNRDNDNLED